MIFNKTTCNALLFLLLFPVTCLSQSYLSSRIKPEWEFFIGASAISASSKGALISDQDNGSIIASFDDEVSTQDKGVIPVVRIAYIFNQGNTEFFLGDSINSTATIEDSGIGITHRLANETQLSISLSGGASSIQSLLVDPFLTNEYREFTDANIYTLNISGENILGSIFSIYYTYQAVDIKTDKSGESIISFQNTSALKALQRSNTNQTLSFSLTLPISENLYVFPNLNYTASVADGAAESFNQTGVGAMIIYLDSKYSLNTNFSTFDSSYKTINPVFNINREDTSSLVNVGLTYFKPFNIKNTFIDLQVGSLQYKSNISLYDASSKYLSLSFLLTF